MNNITTVGVSAQNKTKSYIPHLADLYYAEHLTQEIELPSSQDFAFKQIFVPKIRERWWVCFCYFVTLLRNKNHKNNVLRVGSTLIFLRQQIRNGKPFKAFSEVVFLWSIHPRSQTALWTFLDQQWKPNFLEWAAGIHLPSINIISLLCTFISFHWNNTGG